MLTILRQRNFALLWFAGVISSAGDWVLLTALPYYVNQLTGSALATGAMFTASTLPRLLIAAPAGVFVDRWDRKRTMGMSNVLKAALLLLLFMVRSREWLWVVYVVAFVQSAVGQFFLPAKSALIPRLVSEHQLMTANSLDTLGNGLTRLIGPSLGGAVMALLGLSGVVLLDCISVLISAAMIAFISSPSRSTRESTKTAHPAVVTTWATVWRDWLKGLRLAKSQPVVATVFITVGMVMVSYGTISVLLVVFVREVLREGAIEFGWMVTAQGIGNLIGGSLIAQVGKVVQPSALFPLALGITGMAFLATFHAPTLPLALVFITLAGVAMVGWMVSERTLLQSGVPDQYRGRIFGAYGTSNSLLMLGGIGLASGLAELLGAQPVLNMAGSLYVVAGVVSLLMLRHAKSPGPA